MNNNLFDELAKNLSQVLPKGVDDMKSDFERNARAMLQSSLTKMDLVTREEFDIQAQLLQKSLQRVEELENRLAELEKNQQS